MCVSLGKRAINWRVYYGVITRREPAAAVARETVRAGGAALRRAAARLNLRVATLVVAYLATLAGVVAVPTASALGTIVGTTVLAVFAAKVPVYLAIADYTVIPERNGSFDR